MRRAFAFLILQSPVLLGGALLALFGALAHRRLRRGLDPSRALVVLAIGAAVGAAAAPLLLLLGLALWLSLHWRLGVGIGSALSELHAVVAPPAQPLLYAAWLAWGLAAAWTAAAFTRRPRAARPVAAGWVELAGGLAALLSLPSWLDWAEGVHLRERQRAYEGSSRLDHRAQATPRAVATALRVRQISMTEPLRVLDSPPILALTHDRRLWELAVFSDARDAQVEVAGAPAVAAELLGGDAWFVDTDRQLWRTSTIPATGDHVTEREWPGVRVATITATRAQWLPRRLCAVSDEGEGRCWEHGDRQPRTFGMNLRVLSPDWAEGACWIDRSGAVGCRGAFVGHDERVEGVRDAMSIASNGRLGCAVSRDGELRCWGAQYGGHVDDTGTRVWQSALELQGERVTDVAIGVNHSCAVASGRVLCWAENAWGELCDGTTTSRGAPRSVPGVSDAVGVAVADRRTCFVRAGGELACCGIAPRW